MFGLFSQNAMCSHAFLHLPLARGPIAHKRNYKRVLTRGRTLLSLSRSLSLCKEGQRRADASPVAAIQGKEGISVYLSHDTPARGEQL